MFKLFECLFGIPIHADSDSVFGTGPFEVHVNVLFCFPPVNLERVFCADACDEVVGIVFVCVLDTKVVNHEGEGDVPCVMEEEAFGTRGFVVSNFLQVCNETVMGNFSGLF